MSAYLRAGHLALYQITLPTYVEDAEEAITCGAEANGCFVRAANLVDLSSDMENRQLFPTPEYKRITVYHETCHALDLDGYLSATAHAALLPLLGYSPGTNWIHGRAPSASGADGSFDPPFERFAEACAWATDGRAPVWPSPRVVANPRLLLAWHEAQRRLHPGRSQPDDQPAYDLRISPAALRKVAAVIRGALPSTPWLTA